MTPSWREKLKSGPLQSLYLLARNTKRRLRGEPLAGTVPFAQVPLGVDALRALAETLPGYARLYYSLGLGYLEAQEPAADRKALACLRCAQTLGFEAEERLTLYRALLWARQGCAEQARELADGLDPREMTGEEEILWRQIQTRSVSILEPRFSDPPSGWGLAGRQVLDTSAESLLVVGDTQGCSALWLPQARYLLVAPEVNGLTLEAAGALNLAPFDLAVGPAADQERAQKSGLPFTRWIEVDEATASNQKDLGPGSVP